MSMQMTRSVWQRRLPDFFGEGRKLHPLGPVVADPQQNPPLQIVNHRQIDLPLPSTHLIDANDMHRRTRPMAQAICHGTFHVWSPRSSSSIRTGEPFPANSTPGSVSPPHSRAEWSRGPYDPPRESPSLVVPHRGHSTRCWDCNAASTVRAFRIGQIAPCPRGLRRAVHLSTALSADPTTQQPMSQSVDAADLLVARSKLLLHFRNSMRFQPQLLSENGVDEHLDPLLSGLTIIYPKELDEPGTYVAYFDGNLLHLKPFNLNCTFGSGTSVTMPPYVICSS